MLIQLIE